MLTDQRGLIFARAKRRDNMADKATKMRAVAASLDDKAEFSSSNCAMHVQSLCIVNTNHCVWGNGTVFIAAFVAFL